MSKQVLQDTPNDLIRQLYTELNYPSADNLKRVLKARKIPFKAKDVEKIARDDPVRAVQAAPYRYNGKIAASDLDVRWFMDLIDFTAAPSDGGRKLSGLSTSAGNKYILVVQDVFSRKIWAEALADKRPSTVAEGLDRILKRTKGRKPRSILTDAGSEFQHQFEQYVQSALGIEVRHKDPIDTNAIATLDVAIGQLKKALVRVARRSGHDDWSAVLQKVVDGQNALPNKEYLEGQSPNDVEHNQDLREHLMEINSEFSGINQANAAKRRSRLEDAGGFRAPVVGRAGPTQRAWKPRFEPDVREIKAVEQNKVVDKKDQVYDTRFVRPAAPTDDVPPPATRLEARGSALVQKGQREAMQKYANEIKDAMDQGETVQLNALYRKLRDKKAFDEDASKARLNKARVYRTFVSLFPDIFKLQGTEVSLVATAAAAPVEPPPPRQQRLRSVSVAPAAAPVAPVGRRRIRIKTMAAAAPVAPVGRRRIRIKTMAA